MKWLHAQERLDALRPRALRVGGSQFADVAYANAWQQPPEEVRQALQEAIQSARKLDLQYTPYGGGTVPRREAARNLRDRTGVPVNHRLVVLTSGAMEALHLTLGALEPGEVLLTSPTWIDHPLYCESRGHRPVFVPMTQDFRLDLGAIERSMTNRTRALILCQPGNPSGVIHSREELEGLAQILDRRSALLMADECHRDWTFGQPFTSPLEVYSRTVVVYSYGKRLLTQGQRLGYAAFSPGLSQVADRLPQLARTGGYGMPTAVMQRALPSLERIDAPTREIAVKRKEVVQGLGSITTAGDATMFVYARVGSDWDVTEMLADRGVLVMPSSVFHHEGWVRISCSAPASMLDRCVNALREVVRPSS